jgi:hypothetical protein
MYDSRVREVAAAAGCDLFLHRGEENQFDTIWILPVILPNYIYVSIQSFNIYSSDQF